MKILTVGLTGSIVSGKTTVAKIFQELGAYLIDADVIAREIVRPQQKAWKSIVNGFGKEILKEDQEINRKKLAQIIFYCPEKRKLLNQITHPEIIATIKKRVNQIKNTTILNKICMIDVPLLFEAHMESMMDKIILVYLDREKQIQRLYLRDGLTTEEALSRIQSQMPIEEKVPLADYVIDNRFSPEHTKIQVIRVWTALKKILDHDL